MHKLSTTEPEPYVPMPTTVPIGIWHQPRVVASGNDHSCAVTYADEPWCWGRNSSGQVGNGRQTVQRTPARISVRGWSVSAVSAGLNHTCAIAHEPTSGRGQAFCWGANGDGQLGTGDTMNRSVPVQLPGQAGIEATQVIAMARDSCLHADLGQLGQPGVLTATACAGANLGVWGSGNPVGSTHFTIVGSEGWLQMVGGQHRCEVADTGTVRCTGSNTNGGLGDGTRAATSVLATVGSGYGRSISTGWWNSPCAHHAASSSYRCWGRGAEGQIGDGSTVGRTMPVTVQGVSAGRLSRSGVSVGRTHACAIGAGPEGHADRLFCWGTNTHGQLGNGTVSTRSALPVHVAGL